LSNPGRPVLIPIAPASCCFFKFSKYATAESKSVTSISRIVAVFFLSSAVLVIRFSNASIVEPLCTSVAADLIISFRLFKDTLPVILQDDA